MSMLTTARVSWLAAAMIGTCVWHASTPAQQAGTAPELAAGGFQLAASSPIEPEAQEITLALDRVTVTQTLRNTGDRDVKLEVAFALPDLDASLLWDQPPLLPRPTDVNFVAAAVTADGEPVTLKIEQHASALGLDVTEAVRASGLPLMPRAGMLAQVRAQAEAVRDDLLARAAVRASGDQLVPSWTLRTTAHWRQAFPAGRAVTLRLSYVPVIGRYAGTPDALVAIAAQACLGNEDLHRLGGEAGTGHLKRLSLLSFQATAGAAWSDPVGRVRVTIVKPDAGARIVTCRSDLAPVGPTELEWTARSHAHEADIVVLFIE